MDSFFIEFVRSLINCRKLDNFIFKYVSFEFKVKQDAKKLTSKRIQIKQDNLTLSYYFGKWGWKNWHICKVESFDDERQTKKY